MSRAFKLPDLGEGIHEGEVIAVLVKTGERVEEGDPILEVETDKASVEIPSPYTATVEEILVKPGDTVHVGDVLMTFSGEAHEGGAADRKSEVQPDAGEKAQTTPKTIAEDKTGERKGGPVPASPATRRLARELGVDLGDVAPSGPGGLVTAEDVRAHAQRGPGAADTTTRAAAEKPFTARPPENLPQGEAALPDFGRWGVVEETPLRSIRKATARQMALAWSRIPHVASQDEVDVTRLEALRRRHKPEVETLGGRLTLTVFAVKAAAAALRKYPQFNVSLDTQKGAIIRKQYCHIGVATDTGEGLVVPVLRDVDRKSLVEIAVELKEVVERTRNRKITLEELQGGCFTITNIGAAGGRGHFAPIINYPEAAIIGMGAARLKPAVRRSPNGEAKVTARLILPVVLAIDHRVLDGVDAARFLDYFRKLLEDPEQFLLSV